MVTAADTPPCQVCSLGLALSASAVGAFGERAVDPSETLRNAASSHCSHSEAPLVNLPLLSAPDSNGTSFQNELHVLFIKT